MIVLVIVSLLFSAIIVQAFEKGAPCLALTQFSELPNHSGLKPQPLRNTPYYLELRNATSKVQHVIAGETYKVLMNGHPKGFLLRSMDSSGRDIVLMNGHPKGFLLRSMDSSGRDIVLMNGHPKGFLLRSMDSSGKDIGEFQPDACAQVMHCANDTRYLTHTGYPCFNRPEFHWTAPKGTSGTVKFTLTAVMAYRYFWTGIYAEYPMISEEHPYMPPSYKAVCRKDGNKQFCQQTFRHSPSPATFCKSLGYYCTKTCCSVP